MSKHDVVIALFTIVYSLMLADMFVSLHRLLRSRGPVRWHWLPLAAAWFLLLVILKNWWDLAFIEYGADWMNIYYFLAYGHMLLLIYLAASVVLPDVPGREGTDLLEYYFENHRYFWGLIGSIIFLSLAIGIAHQIQLASPLDRANLVGSLVFVAVAVLLAANRRFRVHVVFVSLLLAMVVLEILGKA